MSRSPPPALEERFRKLRDMPSDINEHLDVLRSYAEQCEHVTEMGMRGAVSTTALLAGQPKKLVSWDIDPLSVISQNVLELFKTGMEDKGSMLVWNGQIGRTTFEPRVGSTLEVVIEPTDLLFIDTLHTAKQLFAELTRHANAEQDRVKKFLIFHDTKTFGDVGEDGTTPGLRDAIRLFQKNNFPVWEVIEDRPNNNGLVVLKSHRTGNGR